MGGGGGGGGGPLSNLKLVAQGLCSLSYHVATAFIALLSSSSFGSAFDTCLYVQPEMGGVREDSAVMEETWKANMPFQLIW